VSFGELGLAPSNRRLDEREGQTLLPTPPPFRSRRQRQAGGAVASTPHLSRARRRSSSNVVPAKRSRSTGNQGAKRGSPVNAASRIVASSSAWRDQRPRATPP